MCRLTDCGCMSLQTGVLIIGLLYLIGSSFSLVGLLVAIIKLFEPHWFYGESDPMPGYYRNFYEGSGFELAFKVTSLVAFAICCLQVAADVLLIFASIKRRAAFAMPWFVLNITLVVLYLGGLLGVSIVGFICMPEVVNVVSIMPLVVAVFYLAISIFFLSVVRSFYVNVKY